ncbi:hypothetical protein [Psychromonas antarctica]|uniref:hypothetical protein n=1 Tax=Psychromonas antarctica TaxID=67573 RepID=UPI001EE7D988|nr:hypothetical protein [Psychromonas antarctica]MCG6202754.1 hypothetical protein [Psychromonas antarctica]
MTYTVATINSDINIKEKYEQFLKNTDATDCPLSSLFSTQHSTMSINAYSVSLNTKDNLIPFSADLKGLWHINDLAEVANLYDAPNGIKKYITVVPYIPNAIYDSYKNGEMDDYITGFEVETSFDDISISYEDIIRFDNYLNHKKELSNLDGDSSIHNEIETKKNYPPSEQASMILVQVLQAYCPFYEELLKEPRGALARLESDFKSKKKKEAFKNLAYPRISESTLARMIKKGKEKLHLN